MAHRTKLTPKKKGKFLEILTQTCNVSTAAKAVDISRQRLYEFRDVDPEFKAQWDEAIETAIDALEAEARRRGLEGFDEPVFYKGEIVGYIRNYSDRMLEIQLKAHRPEKYRDNVRVDGTIKHEYEDPKQALYDRVSVIASRAGQDGGAVSPN